MAYPRTHIIPRTAGEAAQLVGGMIGCIVFLLVLILLINVLGVALHRPGVMLWGA